MKSAPEKKSDARENAVEEKEKDTTEAAAMEEGEEPEGSVKELVIPGVSEPRPLHKTYSLFIRNVPPSVSKADVATVSPLALFKKIILPYYQLMQICACSSCLRGNSFKFWLN